MNHVRRTKRRAEAVLRPFSFLSRPGAQETSRAEYQRQKQPAEEGARIPALKRLVASSELVAWGKLRLHKKGRCRGKAARPGSSVWNHRPTLRKAGRAKKDHHGRSDELPRGNLLSVRPRKSFSQRGSKRAVIGVTIRNVILNRA
jgi:hypothetical protein